jgi:[ribosomal protein S5]-alanine N-acetyltransferase
MLFETPRLLVRAFQPNDTPVIHPILEDAFGEKGPVDNREALLERTEWVQWNGLSHKWFVAMRQAPYGDRAVVLKQTGELIGSAGFVPIIGPFTQIPGLGDDAAPAPFTTAEFGLFWVIGRMHRGKGYATEAAKGLVRYAFRELRLAHVVATTSYDNPASQAVMRKIGMRIEHNPFATPEWLQIVGILHNSEASEAE